MMRAIVLNGGRSGSGFDCRVWNGPAGTWKFTIIAIGRPGKWSSQVSRKEWPDPVALATRAADQGPGFLD